MEQRHSVRRYTDQPIEPDKRAALDKLVSEINRETGLHIQVEYDEPSCFDSMLAHYGKFSGVRNYIAMIGPKGKGNGELLGYHGERIVLKAQELGLNTCWVGMTHGKSRAEVAKGEELVCLIALGHGCTAGAPRSSKQPSEVSNYREGMPEWFLDGINAALLGPSALNKQKFRFELTPEGDVKAIGGRGPFASIDLGIAKYHFEIGSGKKIS